MGDHREPDFLETETIDFKSLFTRNVSASGTFDLRGLEATSLGKLLQTIPLPALLVDGACAIAFSNHASENAGFRSAPLQPGSFSLLFADELAASTAESLIKKVFATRRPEVIEAPLKKGKNRLWGRMHLRSIRIGKRRAVLVIMEDLTLENRRELLEQKHLLKVQRAKEQLEKRLARSAANLKMANSLLKKEIADRKRVEEVLRRAHEKLEHQDEESEETRTKARPCSKKIGAGRSTPEPSSGRDLEQSQSDAATTVIKDFKNFLQVVRNVAHTAEGDLKKEDMARVREHVAKLLKHCSIAEEKIERHTSRSAGVSDTGS